jgi:hypothetical protein
MATGKLFKTFLGHIYDNLFLSLLNRSIDIPKRCESFEACTRFGIFK